MSKLHDEGRSRVRTAMENPQEVEYQQSRDTSKIKGEHAFVVVNADGEVVTTWAKNRRGWYHP